MYVLSINIVIGKLALCFAPLLRYYLLMYRMSINNRKQTQKLTRTHTNTHTHTWLENRNATLELKLSIGKTLH